MLQTVAAVHAARNFRRHWRRRENGRLIGSGEVSFRIVRSTSARPCSARGEQNGRLVPQGPWFAGTSSLNWYRHPAATTQNFAG